MSGPPDREGVQRSAITAMIRNGAFLPDWAGQWVTESERVTLAKYRDVLSGRVLELGIGGGRLTAHLMTSAESLHGIDIAPDMVAHCQQRFPQATFSQEDFRNLSAWPAERWDAVYAGFNSFDPLTMEERDVLISDVARLLRPRGLFIFSAHNFGSVALVKKPWSPVSLNPRRFGRWLVRRPRALRNYRRLAALQRVEEDYAIVVDEAFGLLPAAYLHRARRPRAPARQARARAARVHR